MSEREDLVGQKFNRLTVISFSHKKHSAFWNVKCDCGNEKTIKGSHLKSNVTKSCGCFRKELMSKRQTTHGMEGSLVYGTWHSMVQRCTNINHHAYKNYLGRGITVCKKWLRFEGFYEDMGDKPKGTSLDRINNEGNYCKENCRWATPKEQSNNTRTNINITFNGKTQTIAQWARDLKINVHVLRGRINKSHWSIEKTFTTPVEKRRARA